MPTTAGMKKQTRLITTAKPPMALAALPSTSAHKQTEAAMKAKMLSKTTLFQKLSTSINFSASGSSSHSFGVAPKRFFWSFFDWVVAAPCPSCSWFPTKSTWSWRKLQTEPPPLSVITFASLALLWWVFTSYEARLNSSRIPASQQTKQKRDWWLSRNLSNPRNGRSCLVAHALLQHFSTTLFYNTLLEHFSAKTQKHKETYRNTTKKIRQKAQPQNTTAPSQKHQNNTTKNHKKSTQEQRWLGDIGVQSARQHCKHHHTTTETSQVHSTKELSINSEDPLKVPIGAALKCSPLENSTDPASSARALRTDSYGDTDNRATAQTHSTIQLRKSCRLGTCPVYKTPIGTAITNTVAHSPCHEIHTPWEATKHRTHCHTENDTFENITRQHVLNAIQRRKATAHRDVTKWCPCHHFIMIH